VADTYATVFLRHFVRWPSFDIQEKITEIFPGEPLRRGS